MATVSGLMISNNLHSGFGRTHSHDQHRLHRFRVRHPQQRGELYSPGARGIFSRRSQGSAAPQPRPQAVATLRDVLAVSAVSKEYIPPPRPPTSRPVSREMGACGEILRLSPLAMLLAWVAASPVEAAITSAEVIRLASSSAADPRARAARVAGDGLLSFFTASDIHLGWDPNTQPSCPNSTYNSFELNRLAVDAMNHLPGEQDWEEAMGGGPVVVSFNVSTASSSDFPYSSLNADMIGSRTRAEKTNETDSIRYRYP